MMFLSYVSDHFLWIFLVWCSFRVLSFTPSRHRLVYLSWVLAHSLLNSICYGESQVISSVPQTSITFIQLISSTRNQILNRISERRYCQEISRSSFDPILWLWSSAAGQEAPGPTYCLLIMAEKKAKQFIDNVESCLSELDLDIMPLSQTWLSLVALCNYKLSTSITAL